MARKLSAWNKHVKATAKKTGLKGKALFKRASRTYNKKTKSPKKKTNKSRSTTKSSGKRMGKRKFTIPLAVVAPLLWKISSAAVAASKGDWETAKMDLLWHFAAVDSSFRFNPEALKTWIPVILGLAAHKWIGGAPLNLNRTLGNAGVPLLRI